MLDNYFTKGQFDIYKFLEARPLSWSAISSFDYDPEQWFERYILAKKQPESAEMIFGKNLALSIEDDTCIVPGLLDTLQEKKEQPFKVRILGKIPMVGYADAFDDITFLKLDEVKTGKKPWDKKRADNHGQITLYALFNFIINKIKPENVDFNLYWIPTENTPDGGIDFVKPIQFIKIPTKRTTEQVLLFANYVREVVEKMQDYARARLSNMKTV